jgi:hypothetical protein
MTESDEKLTYDATFFLKKSGYYPSLYFVLHLLLPITTTAPLFQTFETPLKPFVIYSGQFLQDRAGWRSQF